MLNRFSFYLLKVNGKLRDECNIYSGTELVFYLAPCLDEWVLRWIHHVRNNHFILFLKSTMQLIHYAPVLILLTSSTSFLAINNNQIKSESKFPRLFLRIWQGKYNICGRSEIINRSIRHHWFFQMFLVGRKELCNRIFPYLQLGVVFQNS